MTSVAYRFSPPRHRITNRIAYAVQRGNIDVETTCTFILSEFQYNLVILTSDNVNLFERSSQVVRE